MIRFRWHTRIYSNIVAAVLALAMVLPSMPADAGCMDACCCQATVQHAASARFQLAGTNCCDTVGVMPCAMHTAQPPEALDHALIVTSKRADTPTGLSPLVIGPVKSPSPSHGGHPYSAGAMDTPTIPIYLHTATFLC